MYHDLLLFVYVPLFLIYLNNVHELYNYPFSLILTLFGQQIKDHYRESDLLFPQNFHFHHLFSMIRSESDK